MFYRVAATCPSAPRRAGPTRGLSTAAVAAALINRDDLENRYEKWKKMKNKVRLTYIYLYYISHYRVPNLGNIIYLEDDFFFLFGIPTFLPYPADATNLYKPNKGKTEESAAASTYNSFHIICIII